MFLINHARTHRRAGRLGRPPQENPYLELYFQHVFGSKLKGGFGGLVRSVLLVPRV